MCVCTVLQIEALNSDYEKLQKANAKLQKVSDSLEDEKLFLQSELNRMTKDAEIRYIYEGESNENRKTEIKIRNIAPLSYKLADMLPVL
jgi:rootletin